MRTAGDLARGLRARGHAFVKRNPLLKRYLSRTLRLLVGVRSTRGLSAVSPPSGAVSVVDWGREACASGGRLWSIYPPATLERRLPRTIDDDIFWIFEQNRHAATPPMYVAEIPSGRAWQANAVISERNELITELSKSLTDRGLSYRDDVASHPIFDSPRLSKPTLVPGNVALLAAPGGGGYYHWMIDAIPRFHLLAQAGIGVDQIEKVIVNSFSAPFHREVMRRVGVEGARVFESQWQPHVQASRLVVPSLPGELGSPSRWVLDYLRKLFSDELEESQPSTRLFVSRSQTSHRRLTNESELEDLLRREGFRTVVLEELDMREQVRLFAGAEAVCSVHGAGLTNILFCRPGTRVIEIFPSRFFGVHYWSLAELAGLDYWYLIGRGERLSQGVEPPPGAGREDVEVEPSRFARTLRAALS